MRSSGCWITRSSSAIARRANISAATIWASFGISPCLAVISVLNALRSRMYSTRMRSMAFSEKGKLASPSRAVRSSFCVGETFPHGPHAVRSGDHQIDRAQTDQAVGPPRKRREGGGRVHRPGQPGFDIHRHRENAFRRRFHRRRNISFNRGGVRGERLRANRFEPDDRHLLPVLRDGKFAHRQIGNGLPLGISGGDQKPDRGDLDPLAE